MHVITIAGGNREFVGFSEAVHDSTHIYKTGYAFTLKIHANHRGEGAGHLLGAPRLEALT
ncbi:hypothetical protein MRA01_58310 [Methylobacterium radiotolerans]|nr:hypothetical protein MRA01_58310 [Methylobacterium radiotolerans]